jgi:hypothetical protein
VNSIKYASAAMVLDIGLGVLIGYLIVRTAVRGRHVLDALCMLPLAVPGLVLAFGYVAVSQRWPMGKGGPLGDMILGADPNPVPLLVIAYAVRRLPYIVRSTVAGLEQTSGELEEAAVNLGASRFTAVRRVIVPLIMANLIAGASGVQLLDAGGVRQPDPGPAVAALPDHAGDLRVHGAAGGWGVHRQRDGGVGDGAFDGDARRRVGGVGEEAGVDFQGVGAPHSGQGDPLGSSSNGYEQFAQDPATRARSARSMSQLVGQRTIAARSQSE